MRTDCRLPANIDIAPTIDDAAGVTPNYTPDGRSLLGGGRRDYPGRFRQALDRAASYAGASCP